MCIWIFIYTGSFIFHLPTSGSCAAQTQLKLYEKINQNCNKMQKMFKISATNQLIGEVVQSRRRTLLESSPG